MSVAVCIKCGARKRGALTLCLCCRFDPAENSDKAKSMILTDHFLSLDDLNGIGERIRAGLPVTYPEEAVAEYEARFAKVGDKLPEATRMGCIALVVVVLCALASLALRCA